MANLELSKTPIQPCPLVAMKRNSPFGAAIALPCGGGLAHAQSENTSTWPAQNRYVALSLGQQQQNYRELDTQGITTNGTLNTESGGQRHLGSAISWQTDNGWLAGLDAQRQAGATAYNGYLQAGNGSLSPYSARTGNVATEYSKATGYGLDASESGVPVVAHSSPDYF